MKKAGKNYQACCPFHDEKSPSFTVSQDKQFYHCFGCGAHGDVIGFVSEINRIDFIEAVRMLDSSALDDNNRQVSFVKQFRSRYYLGQSKPLNITSTLQKCETEIE